MSISTHDFVEGLKLCKQVQDDRNKKHGSHGWVYLRSDFMCSWDGVTGAVVKFGNGLFVPSDCLLAPLQRRMRDVEGDTFDLGIVAGCLSFDGCPSTIKAITRELPTMPDKRTMLELTDCQGLIDSWEMARKVLKHPKWVDFYSYFVPEVGVAASDSTVAIIDRNRGHRLCRPELAANNCHAIPFRFAEVLSKVGVPQKIVIGPKLITAHYPNDRAVFATVVRSENVVASLLDRYDHDFQFTQYAHAAPKKVDKLIERLDITVDATGFTVVPSHPDNELYHVTVDAVRLMKLVPFFPYLDYNGYARIHSDPDQRHITLSSDADGTSLALLAVIR